MKNFYFQQTEVTVSTHAIIGIAVGLTLIFVLIVAVVVVLISLKTSIERTLKLNTSRYVSLIIPPYYYCAKFMH